MTQQQLKNIIKNGGATLAKNGKAIVYKRGYQVSIYDMVIMPAAKLSTSYLVKLRKTLQADEFLGIWVDNGTAYLDISKRINNRSKAIEFGNRNNQQSIYGWARQELIFC